MEDFGAMLVLMAERIVALEARVAELEDKDK